jgi:DNA-binding transcriptional LysR family regulator
MLDLCAAGRGLAIVSAQAPAHYQRPGVTFVPLHDVEQARAALCWRSDERDPGVHAYLSTALELAREHSPSGPLP